MTFKLSHKAQIDLIEIWEYTFQNWSKNQADRYYKGIFNKINEICENPLLGKNYQHVRKGYWGALFKSHVVFYKIDNKKEQVEIIRVLHQSMDLMRKIKE